MTKKPKLTKKDSYLLILGVLLGFLGERGYDVAHEFAFVRIEAINWYWILLQFCFLVLFGFLAYVMFRQVERE